MLGQAIDHGPEVEGDLSDPSRQRGTVNMYARPGQDLCLAIQGAVVGVLGDGNLGQCALGWQRALDQPRPGRRLGHAVGAGPAGIPGPDRHDDAELRRDDVQALRAVFADPVHLAAAAGAFEALRLDDFLDPGQVLGQVAEVPVDRGAFLARRWRRRVGFLRRGLDLLDRNRQIFEGELALVFRQLLGLPPMQRMAQFLYERLLALIGLGKQVDPTLQCLERRPMLGRQEAQIEIVWTGCHGPDYIVGSEV